MPSSCASTPLDFILLYVLIIVNVDRENGFVLTMILLATTQQSEKSDAQAAKIAHARRREQVRRAQR